MREPEIRPHCDDMYICEKYGLNRISLSCIIKIKGANCPKYTETDEGDIVEIQGGEVNT